MNFIKVIIGVLIRLIKNLEEVTTIGKSKIRGLANCYYYLRNLVPAKDLYDLIIYDYFMSDMQTILL